MQFKRLYKSLIVIFWIFIGITTLLQYSEIQPKGFLKQTVKFNQFLFPQGWGFFSKDALEEEYILYKFNDKTNLFEKVSMKNSDPKNLFGLSRNARIQMANEARVFSDIKLLKHTQVKLKDILIDRDIISNIDTIEIFSYSNKELDKGKYLCLKKGLVPFVWSEINQISNMDVQILIIQN